VAAGEEHVFISYNADDKALAEELAGLIDARACPAWIAPRDIRSGSDFSEQIHQAIHSCVAFVVLVSESSNRSRYVRAETQQAFNAGLPIHPVRFSAFQPTGGFAFFLQLQQWTDAFGPRRKVNLERLLRDLAAAAGRPLRRPTGKEFNFPNQRPGVTRAAAARPALILSLLGLGAAAILLASALMWPGGGSDAAARSDAAGSGATANGQVASDDTAKAGDGTRLIRDLRDWVITTTPLPPPENVMANEAAGDVAANAASDGNSQSGDVVSNTDGM
jgi:hypothetical protein